MSADSARQRDNVLFTFATLGLVAAVGSGVTVILAAACFWVLFLRILGAPRPVLPAYQRLIVIIFGQFAVIGFVMSRVHYGTAPIFGGSEYLLFLAPLILLPRFVFKPPERNLRTFLMRTMAGAGIIAAVLAIAEFMIWGGRVAAVPGNPLILAPVVGMAGLGALALLVDPPTPRDRIWAMIGWLGALTAITLSQSRTIITLFLACTVLFAILNWRQLAQKLHRLVLLSGLVFIIAGTMVATFSVVDRLIKEPPIIANNQPSSAQWRLVYLEAGSRVAAENLLIGVGRDERAIEVGAKLEAMNMPTRLREIVQVTSWHRWIPEPVRSIVMQWQTEHWEAQTLRLEENGEATLPARPAIEQETRSVVLSPHQHLHNAYLTMLVDHGLIGLASLLVLIFGPLLAGYHSGILRSDPVLFKAYCVIIFCLALSGLTNLHIENDIIASYFIALSIVFWATFRPPDGYTDVPESSVEG